MRSLMSLVCLAACLGAASAPKPTPDANPLLEAWTTPFGVPPFDRIRPEHFPPAFREGLERQRREIRAILENPEAPSFRNTVEALEDSGELLEILQSLLHNLAGAENSDGLQAVSEQVEPMLAAHGDDLWLDRELFARVRAVHDQRDRLGLGPEERTLLERTFRRFVRGGANLAPAAQARLRAVNGQISRLTLQFNENLLKETAATRLVVERREDLAGLPERQLAAAAEAARKAGLEGRWVFTLQDPSIWPFLQTAQNRDLRKRLHDAYMARCSHGGVTDNRTVFRQLALLRAEKAQLLGFRTWADFALGESMAGGPAAVDALIGKLLAPALARAREERAELQAMIDAEGGGYRLQPWDWSYYAEKVRKARYDFDEQALRPYFAIDRVREGAFLVARKLYGLTFAERKDLPVYHPEVRAFEIRDRGGAHLGVLYVDYHPRPSKQGSTSWASALRDQWYRDGRRVAPIVVNVGNYSRPAGGVPALLAPAEARILFHEFGHALSGFLAQCRYRSSSRDVATDFTELPSQILENWAFEPEVLRLYARHHRTGEAIPEALIQKMRSASRFHQGSATLAYLASVRLDMDWHGLPDLQEVDADSFERASLARTGVLPEILVKRRTPCFFHVVNGYAAGFYSYIWSEMLDSDAFAAFREAGDLFDPKTASAFRDCILATGASEDPALLFRRFRGRQPRVEPLLEKRGLR